MASDLRFDVIVAECWAVLDPNGLGRPEAYPVVLRWDLARENVSDRLKGIFARRGRSTGADAQI